MNVIDSYNQMMKTSSFRTDAVEKLVLKIKTRSMPREISEETMAKLKDVLTSYEVEDGVTIFFASGKPEEKEQIAEIDVGKEYMILWWGENLAKKKSSYPNKYALGITFRNKKEHELAFYTHSELVREFPDFAEFFKGFEKGSMIRICCYAKAGLFAKAVDGKTGEWIIQTPQNKSFIPTRSIGLKTSKNEVYLFQYGKKIRTQRYIRNVKIV